MGLVSFGNYSFSLVKQVRDNFRDATPIASTLPFAYGTWNETGTTPPPAAKGMVEVGLTLASETDPEGMEALRDAVKGLRYLGMQKLIYQPSDPTADSRYTWAIVNNINITNRDDEHTDHFQEATIYFYCPYPFWYGGDYQGDKAGDAGLVAGSGTFGTGAYEIECSGLQTTETVTNNGNAPSVCALTIAPQNIGESCENPLIERLVGGMVVDRFQYMGTVDYEDSLEVNGHTHRVTLNGETVYDDCEWGHPHFLRLDSGANSLRVSFANAGDDASVFLYFADVWS